MLDVRRLILLREFATRGTIAAAANALHLTGPAISQQLAVLEREAGVALLSKKGRILELTAAGRALVAHADVILADLARAETDLAALRGGTLGTVRIAAFPTAARVLISRLFDPRNAPPGLDFRMQQHEPDQALVALAAREVDLAIAHDYSLMPRDLPVADSTTLLTDPVRLTISTEEFARRGLEAGAPVSLADFSTATWLAPGQDASFHELVKRACGAAGFVLNPIVNASDTEVLTALVAADA
nr:LysR family transcriptional regulator [Streptomyces sp. S1D4-11]QIZ00749.1 LysR family transcriptional regulator [Streptomyces sp. S1D4-11]